MNTPPAAGRTLRGILVVSLPALAVFAALWAAGAVGAAVAAAGYGAALACLALAAARQRRDAVRLAAHVDRLAARAGPAAAPAPAAVASAALAPLASAVVRYGHRAARERERLEAAGAADGAVVAALPDPLLILDAERRIVRANAAAGALFGADIVGRDLATALRDPKMLQAVDEVSGGAGPLDLELRWTGNAIERQLAARVAGLGEAAAGERRTIIGLHDLTLVKQSERMRADFVANVSHELRSPLASLSGFIETLQGPAREDAAARERFLAIMREQAERMNRLVDDLLSLSRIELVEHTPPGDTVDVGEVLRAVVEGLQPQAAARRMALEVERAGAAAAVPGDRDQLAQVFRNLIDNAIKYGREASPVTVRIERRPGAGDGARGDMLAIAIEDRGPGIAREHLPRLTERFYRVDAGRSRALGGTGLGLAIVKHIVNRHRGALAIESEVGRGSRFVVSLPLAADAASSGEPPPVTRLSSKGRRPLAGRRNSAPRPAAGSATPAPP